MQSHSLFEAFEKELEPQNDENTSEFTIIGASSPPTWLLPTKALEWYKKVADIELKTSEMQEIEAKYTPPESESSHFEPPKFPASLWQIIKPTHDSYRLKICYKTQSYLYQALMPLLSTP
jgi:hypothetical protein